MNGRALGRRPVRAIRKPGDYCDGMTLREHYAGLALQGLLADRGCIGTPESFARSAVRMSDALLDELAAERTP